MADPIKWTPELVERLAAEIHEWFYIDTQEPARAWEDLDLARKEGFRAGARAVLAVVGEALLSKEAHAQGFKALYGGDGVSPQVTAVLRAAMEAAR